MSPFLSVLGTGPVPLVTTVSTGGFSMVFDYYMYGQYMGVWLMYWENNGTLSGPLTFTANGVSGLTSLSGQQQTARGQSWRTAIVDLSSYAGQTGRVVWLYYRNTNAGSNWQADIAFDAFRFTNDSGVITNIFPTAGSTAFQGQSIGRTYSSLANSVSDWNNASIILRTINTTYRYNGPWWFDTFSPPSSSTGPNDNSPNNTASDYHLICETSNFNQTNMYSNNRYAFFTTTNLYTDGVLDTSSYVRNNLVFHIDAGDTNCYNPNDSNNPNADTEVNSLVGNITNSSYNSNISYSTSDGGYWTFGSNTGDGIEFDSITNFMPLGTNDMTYEIWLNTIPATELATDNYPILGAFGLTRLDTNGYKRATFYHYYFLSPVIGHYLSFRKSSSASGGGYESVVDSDYDNSQWNHLVISHDVSAGKPKYYYNGSERTLASSDDWDTYYNNNNDQYQLNVGSNNMGNKFRGKISILRIYKGTALTASEVTQNFNAEKARYGYS